MKKAIVTLSATAIVLVSSLAMAADKEIAVKPYAAINGGLSLASDSKLTKNGFAATMSFEPGFAIGGSFGADFGAARAEVEIAYKTSSTDKIEAAGNSASIDGDMGLLSYMLNGYVNIPLGTSVKPYVGAGLGVATAYASELKYQGTVITKKVNDTKFAYQVSAGLGIDATESVVFDIQYRYLGASDFDFEGTKAEYGSHNFLAGLRYKF